MITNWLAAAGLTVNPVLVPVALASLVGVYLTWALTTASSLLQ